MVRLTEGVEDLVSRARVGDEVALATLVQRVQPEVLRRCARFLPFRQDAAEACQQALAKVSSDIHTCGGDSLFLTWLYTVVADSARQTYRSMRRRAVQRQHPGDTGGGAVSQSRDPRTTSVLAGSRVELLEALDELEREHPGLVQPLVLRDLCQLDYETVAGSLDLPLGTVKSRIHEGRKHLRRSLTVER